MFTINVYPGMMTLDCLGLDWDVQPHMEPYAKEYIILSDTAGNSIWCRVNARVTMLKGKGLSKFFARLGTGKFTVTMLERGKFLVEPAQVEKAPLAAGNRRQRDEKETAGNGAAGCRDNGGCAAGERGVEARPKGAEAQPKGAEARPIGTEAQSKATEARPKAGVSASKASGRAKEKNRKITPGPEKKQPVATERVEHLPRPAAGVGAIPDRVAAEQAGHLPDVANPGGQSPAQSPGEANQQSPARDTATNNLVITFFQADDALLLKAAETAAAQAGSLEDLYLRRQALELSLSPDYGTLLSLSAARDVQPLEYQQQTVRHVLQNLRGRALLCDEVGLGKTIEAGLIMMEYVLRGLVRRVLVLAPPSLVEQWREEMQSKFNLDFVAYDSHEFKAEPNPWGKFPRIIASLDTAKRDNHRRQVLETEYDMVIVDEAHHLKNSRTKAYQLISRLKKKYILLLTATPVENDLSELFNLITLLLPGQLETASSFKRKYVTRGNPLKVKNAADLKRLVREVMVRNRRSETGAIAGRRRAEVVEVALSPAEEAFYRRLTTFVRGHYTPGAERPTGGVNRFVLKMLQREAGSSLEALIPTLDKISANQDHPDALRRLCGTLAVQARKIHDRSKADVLVRMLDRINERVVVVTGFRETQRFLAGLLRERGLEVAELHGGMRRLEKEEQVRLFASGARVLVSTETGSEGRNLQFCRT